jgi:16S rRNA C1402 N4-methylase RsmH
MEPSIKKALVPEEEEINENNRARRARMRVAIRL